jgi:hypothetical protein
VVLISLGVGEGFFEGVKPLHSPTFPKRATLPSLVAKPNPGPPVPLLNLLTIMPNWGSLHDTQLKTNRRYVFSSSILVLSCLQDSRADYKPSQNAHCASAGALTEVAFSSKAILASLSASSDCKLGQTVHATNRIDLDLNSSRSSSKVEYLVYKVVMFDMCRAHSSHSVSSNTTTKALVDSSSLSVLSYLDLNSLLSRAAFQSNLS